MSHDTLNRVVCEVSSRKDQRRKTKFVMQKMRKELMEAGLMHFEEGALECLNPDLTVDDQAELLPYDKKWEFPRERLKLGEEVAVLRNAVRLSTTAARPSDGIWMSVACNIPD